MGLTPHHCHHHRCLPSVLPPWLSRLPWHGTEQLLEQWRAWFRARLHCVDAAVVKALDSQPAWTLAGRHSLFLVAVLTSCMTGVEHTHTLPTSNTLKRSPSQARRSPSRTGRMRPGRARLFILFKHNLACIVHRHAAQRSLPQPLPKISFRPLREQAPQLRLQRVLCDDRPLPHQNFIWEKKSRTVQQQLQWLVHGFHDVLP